MKHYNEAHASNIDICFDLRELLKEYNTLIDELFKDTKKDNEKKIKNDIKIIWKEMNLHLCIDKNIKIYDENKNYKEFSDSEILGYFIQYDPYFKEEKYKYKIETFIFDYIKFDSMDK